MQRLLQLNAHENELLLQNEVLWVPTRRHSLFTSVTFTKSVTVSTVTVISVVQSNNSVDYIQYPRNTYSNELVQLLLRE